MTNRKVNSSGHWWSACQLSGSWGEPEAADDLAEVMAFFHISSCSAGWWTHCQGDHIWGEPKASDQSGKWWNSSAPCAAGWNGWQPDDGKRASSRRCLSNLAALCSLRSVANIQRQRHKNRGQETCLHSASLELLHPLICAISSCSAIATSEFLAWHDSH